MHPTLGRLDRLAHILARDTSIVAVLGLGSAGVQTDRFDEHSDIDFFVVVDSCAAKQRLLDDVGWLSGFGGEVVYSFVNDLNGRKALFADGLFVEYAVFTLPQVTALPYAGARTVWSRPGTDLRGPESAAVSPAPALDTVEFHLNEALTNLYVGLHRDLRGERLTALRFIQVFAVDRILALVRLDPSTRLRHRDPFEPTRRIEQAATSRGLPLAQMCPGYAGNREAAACSLQWLVSRYHTEPAIVTAVEQLLHRRPTQPAVSDA